MLTFTLYTTDHCTLCDAAFDWLQQSAALRGARLQTLDVASSDVLLERYGARVPVLAHGERTLDWPFTEQGVRSLMTAQSPGGP